MSEPLTKAEALENLDYLAKQPYDPYCDGCVEAYAIAKAIAAWLREVCVVEGGHQCVAPDTGKSLDHCWNCGQRRAEEGVR